jgi:hypothetical protein
MYRTLDAAKIIATIDHLKARVDERFAGSGLTGVAKDLSTTALDTQKKALTLAKPIWGVRLLPSLLVAACVGIALLIANSLGAANPSPTRPNFEPTNLLQPLEDTINTIGLAGAAILFLATVERRIKRHRALRALHQLRSLIHVIDMHQLTKDPSLLLRVAHSTATSTSPKRTLSPFELGRYLDYSSEMLSLTGKVAALYAQDFDDSVAIEAVNDLEMFATNLSRKIWQKTAILQVALQDAEGAGAVS